MASVVNADGNSSTLLFLHVPKAAGTTLTAILERQFDHSRIFHVTDTKRAQEELLSVPETERARMQLVTGHYAYGLHKCLKQRYEYVTVLRDPIERTISHYYYVLRNPTHYLYPRVTSEKMSLEEYVQASMTRELDNGQTRLISGAYYRDPRGACSRDLLEMAMENLRNGCAVAGLAERFDETVRLLALTFGWKHTPYVSMNVTAERPRVEQLPPSTIEAIRQANFLDLELYSFAAGLFESAVRDCLNEPSCRTGG